MSGPLTVKDWLPILDGLPEDNHQQMVDILNDTITMIETQIEDEKEHSSYKGMLIPLSRMLFGGLGDRDLVPIQDDSQSHDIILPQNLHATKDKEGTRSEEEWIASIFDDWMDNTFETIITERKGKDRKSTRLNSVTC